MFNIILIFKKYKPYIKAPCVLYQKIRSFKKKGDYLNNHYSHIVYNIYIIFSLF